MASWLTRRYANPKIRGSNPGLDILRIFSVKTRLSTLGTGDIPRGSSRKTKFGGQKERLERLELPLVVVTTNCISGIRLGLQWKLRTIDGDKPFGLLVLKCDSQRLHSETT